jgi:hypothetical protein
VRERGDLWEADLRRKGRGGRIERWPLGEEKCSMERVSGGGAERRRGGGGRGDDTGESTNERAARTGLSEERMGRRGDGKWGAGR